MLDKVQIAEPLTQTRGYKYPWNIGSWLRYNLVLQRSWNDSFEMQSAKLNFNKRLREIATGFGPPLLKEWVTR